jgi:hypothetical protein
MPLVEDVELQLPEDDVTKTQTDVLSETSLEEPVTVS